MPAGDGPAEAVRRRPEGEEDGALLPEWRGLGKRLLAGTMDGVVAAGLPLRRSVAVDSRACAVSTCGWASL